MRVVPFDQAAIPQSDKGRRLKQRDYLQEGSLAVIDQGQQQIGGYTDDQTMAFEGELPVVLFGDHTRSVKLVNHPFAVGADGIKIFRPAAGVRAKYLYYWMKSAPIPDRGYGRHYQFLRQLSVPLPSEDEQDEIVAELEKQFSRLDEAVANLQRVKANLKRYKASVLKAAVEGRFATPDESRSSPSSSGSRSELLDISRTKSIGKIRRGVPESVPLSEAAQTIKVPSGWCLRSVAELLRVGAIVDLKDGNHGTNHPRTSDFVNKGLPFLTASEVVDFHIAYDGAYKVAGEPLAKLKVGFAEAGDVILTHKGTVGRVAICDRSCVLSPQTTYYRLNTSYFLAHYFQYFLASHSFTIQLNAIKSQTTRDYVPISEQYRLFIVCPPLGEQARIVAEVDRHLSIIREVEAEVDTNLQRAQALRQATLAKAFSVGNQTC